MAFDFPATPTAGEIFGPPGGPIYQYNPPTWDVVEGGTSSIDGYWPTRADLVADVGAGLGIYDGKTYPAGGYQYVGKTGATAIPDLPGLLPLGDATPFHFGGIGDGVADDTSAIQQAVDYLFNTFRSGTVDMSGGKWLVDSANIVMKVGVQLKGSWENGGTDEGLDNPPMRFDKYTSCIILNPLYTILFTMGDGMGLRGLVILRKGLGTPYLANGDTRAAIDAVNAFSGTAVTVGTGVGGGTTAQDCYLGHLCIYGFEYGIKLDYGSRHIVEYIKGDNINCIYWIDSYDMQHCSHCHFWPFVTSNCPPVTYAVTGAVNNGSGLIRLTVDTNVIVTGDTLVVAAVGGTVEANGRWTVTKIDDTHVDLQGSVFTNAYTSVGTAKLSPYIRKGKAYWFQRIDWAQMDTCFDFGHDIGCFIDNSGRSVLLNCGFDQFSATGDPTSVGILVSGTNSTDPHLIGCRTAAHGTGIRIDIGTGHNAVINSANQWGIYGTCIDVISGYASIVNSTISGGKGIVVDPNADGIYAAGNMQGPMGGLMLTLSGAALRRSTIRQNKWADASSVGFRETSSNSQSSHYITNYNSNTAGPIIRYQKSGGTSSAPVAPVTSDNVVQMEFDAWDGVDQFRTGAFYRVLVNGTVSPTAMPMRHYWGCAPNGSSTPASIMALQTGLLYPVTDLGMALGATTLRWSSVVANQLWITDGIATPTGHTGCAAIYVDTADGDLKVRFADGTIKTIVVDT